VQRKPSVVVGTPANITCYTLPLATKGHTLAAGDTELITVSAVYSKAQVWMGRGHQQSVKLCDIAIPLITIGLECLRQIPFPATVRQGDPQRVKFSSMLCSLSPYKVAAQASKVPATSASDDAHHESSRVIMCHICASPLRSILLISRRHCWVKE
jgi:hypothetical protein